MAYSETYFKDAVKYLIKGNQFPTARALNSIVHCRVRTNLNGRETKWRKEVLDSLKLVIVGKGQDRKLVKVHELSKNT